MITNTYGMSVRKWNKLPTAKTHHRDILSSDKKIQGGQHHLHGG